MKLTSRKFIFKPLFRELTLAYRWVDSYSGGTLCRDLVRSEDRFRSSGRVYSVENSLIPSGTFNTGQDASSVKII